MSDAITADEASDVPDSEEATGILSRSAKGLSRRVFLARGSAAMLAAGMSTALPGLSSSSTEVASDVTAPAAEATVAETTTLDEPLVAQIRNLQTGEMSLFSGEQEIIVRDPALAAKLFQATK